MCSVSAPPGVEARSARAIEIGRVQKLRRAAGIGEIEHDQVVALRRRAHEAEAVADHERQARVVERAAMDRAEILARDVDDRERRSRRASPIAIDGCFSSSSADPPSPPPTISARSGFGCESAATMDEVLVIEELVALGGHEMAVEAEQLAERHAVVHLDRLDTPNGTARTCAPIGCRSPSRRSAVPSSRRVRGRAARPRRPEPARQPSTLPRWITWYFVRAGFSSASSALNSRFAFSLLSVARLQT